MTAPQTITLDHPVSHDQPNSHERPSGRVSARTASASVPATVRGTATGAGRWARIAAATGRRVLDDLSGSVDTVLAPTVPTAAATYLLFLTR
jgi:hypothetical protein